MALGWLCTPESMPSICLVYGFGLALWWLWVALPGLSAFCLLPSLGGRYFHLTGARIAEQPIGSEVRPESGRFFPGATRAVVPKPTEEANGCKLRHVSAKTFQKAQYVGFSESAQPLQVVSFGWPRFPVPGCAPRMSAGPIYGLTLPTTPLRQVRWIRFFRHLFPHPHSYSTRPNQ